MTTPILMTNAAQQSMSVDSLPSHVLKVLQQNGAEFGMQMAKKLNFSKNAAEFFSRELSYFYPQLLLKKYPKYTFRLYTDIITAPLWKTEIVFNIADLIGEAEFSTSGSNEYDYADTNLTEAVAKILQTGTAITFTFVERAAAEALTNPAVAPAAGNIIRAKMEALIRMNEAKKNKLFFLGSSIDGITGLLNNTDIPKASVTTPWATASADDMLNDLLNAANQIGSQSNRVFSTNTMAISSDKYAVINAKARSLYSDWTITKWVENNIDGIDRIIPDPFLNGQGTGNSGVIVCLDRDTEHHNMVVSADLVGQQVQFEGQKEVMPFISRMSGWNLLQQQSVYIAEAL